MSIRDTVAASLRELDPAESWELPFSESEAGPYFRERRGSYPFTPRGAEEVPPEAMSSLAEPCGIDDLHEVFIIPMAVRSTGVRGRKIISPASVLVLGTRAVGLWTARPQPGVRVLIGLEDLCAIEDVAILLYGRLSFLSSGQALRIRYNMVARAALEPALLQLRGRMAGSPRPVPPERPGAPALPFKWEQLLRTPQVRLDGDAPVSSRFASVAEKARRGAPRGQLVVLNPREFMFLCEPAGATNRYGVDTFIIPRERVTGVKAGAEGLEVIAQEARFSLSMAPVLAETAESWFR